MSDTTVRSLHYDYSHVTSVVGTRNGGLNTEIVISEEGKSKKQTYKTYKQIRFSPKVAVTGEHPTWAIWTLLGACVLIPGDKQTNKQTNK